MDSAHASYGFNLKESLLFFHSLKTCFEQVFPLFDLQQIDISVLNTESFVSVLHEVFVVIVASLSDTKITQSCCYSYCLTLLSLQFCPYNHNQSYPKEIL